jgi:hypothetical protein
MKLFVSVGAGMNLAYYGHDKAADFLLQESIMQRLSLCLQGFTKVSTEAVDNFVDNKPQCLITIVQQQR